MSIPNDCWLIVFQYLDFQSLINCQRLSKVLCQYAKKSCFWHQLFHENYLPTKTKYNLNYIFTEDDFKRIVESKQKLKRGTELKSILLDGNKNVSFQDPFSTKALQSPLIKKNKKKKKYQKKSIIKIDDYEITRFHSFYPIPGQKAYIRQKTGNSLGWYDFGENRVVGLLKYPTNVKGTTQDIYGLHTFEKEQFPLNSKKGPDYTFDHNKLINDGPIQLLIAIIGTFLCAWNVSSVLNPNKNENFIIEPILWIYLSNRPINVSHMDVINEFVFITTLQGTLASSIFEDSKKPALLKEKGKPIYTKSSCHLNFIQKDISTSFAINFINNQHTHFSNEDDSTYMIHGRNKHCQLILKSIQKGFRSNDSRNTFINFDRHTFKFSLHDTMTNSELFSFAIEENDCKYFKVVKLVHFYIGLEPVVVIQSTNCIHLLLCQPNTICPLISWKHDQLKEILSVHPIIDTHTHSWTGELLVHTEQHIYYLTIHRSSNTTL